MLDLLFIGKFDCYHVYIFIWENCNNTHTFFFSVLLLPMAHFFNTKFDFTRTSRVNNCNSFVSLIGILAFISYQISDIASDFADIRKNVTLFITDIQRYIRTNFHVSLWEQRKYLEDKTLLKKGKKLSVPH
jgi:hypothetical protein